MILLNFSHPTSEEQIEQIKRCLGLDITSEELQIVKVECQLDINVDFDTQIVDIVDSCNLTPEQWQTEQLLINPPALSTAAVLMLAELHGRCGYYPPALRFKQEDGIIPPRYVLAEVLDVNAQRQSARKRR